MKDLTTKAADNIRILAASMVEKAKSGHPGGAMGGADFVNILYSEFLRYNPDDSRYPFRDRFFLDPGHMSPMLYSVLALAGYFNMDELAAFRQWGSPTPGHPEVDLDRGIENTSGPLGQGHAMALGAAIAERFLVARFGDWMAHKTYAFISDGGIQEEVSQGVGRIAGHLGLSNLIMFYDSNNIQLSTKVEEVSTEDIVAKYEAWGWSVISIDGNDPAEIRQALSRAVAETGTRQVVIVREAQSLRRLEQLSLYTASPCATTILVLCHKERNMDKRSQLYKQIAGRGVVFESVRPRDYEIAGWLAEYIRSRNCTIDAKSVSMLVDHLGADIAKIANEIDKLMTFLPEGTSRITAEHIEQNIGISKDFNNFELTRALSEKDMARALRIADHFARNPKENPLLVTLGTLFTHFQRIFIVNYQRWLCRRKGTPMPPDAELARMLKLSSAFFLKEYQQAASLYPNSRVFAIMGLIREYDLKSKGIDSGQATDGELLKELLLKIFVLR